MPDRNRLLILLAVMTLLRVVTAAFTPMVAGEAYYWLWGKHLAPGYFDHPPMTGLIGALSFGWIEGVELAARSGAIILAVFTTLAVYVLCNDLFPGTRAGWRAALLYSLIPICDLNGMFFSPDNSLALFTVLTWLFFWRAANRPDSLPQWIAAGVFAGLSLLSKFHAWVLLPPLYLFLIISPAHRPALKRIGPWLAMIIALAVLSPNLIWNARNDWMNYAFQWQRSDLPEYEFESKNIPLYFLGPLGSLSPLVYIAMVWGTWRGLRIWWTRRDPAVLLLLCAGLPLVLFLGALSVLVTISLHWPGVGQLALILLAVGLMERGELFSPRYRTAMLIVAGAMTLLLHIAPFVFRFVPDRIQPPFDLKAIELAELKGEYLSWPEVGERIAAIHAEMNAAAPTVLMAKNWHTASLLAFYSGRLHDTFVYTREDAHNYEIWRADRGGLVGHNVLVVMQKSDPEKQHADLVAKYDKYHRTLDLLFDRVVERPSIICYSDGSIEEYMGFDVSRPRRCEFMLFECYGYNGKLDED